MKRLLKANHDPSFLPDDFIVAHELCFLVHDFLVALLRSAESQGVFTYELEFRDDADREAFANAENVFDWLDATRRDTERAEILRMVIFPALLSDFLHFVYEALLSSGGARLTVAYALLRKPLQEHLCIFEFIAEDLSRFSSCLVRDPALLSPLKVGEVAAHARRIDSVLKNMGVDDVFDAKFLAQLRYDKGVEDGFSGACNKAIHIVTTHKSIRTEVMDLNFIFSGWDAKLTQWRYVYSRLPYVLLYAHRLVEYVFGAIQCGEREYWEYMQRRLAAATLLWSETVREPYQRAEIAKLIGSVRRQLADMCASNGRRVPIREDLQRMRVNGSWPGESRLSAAAREMRLNGSALISRMLRQRCLRASLGG